MAGGGGKLVVMVAEKPSICNSIAHALCGGAELSTRGRSPPVHEFHGRFEGQAARIRVTSVTGHVFSTDFPGQYSNWEAVDPVDLFRAPTCKEPTSKFITHHLASEGKGADVLVLWLDCDREGENICFEVIDCMQQGFKSHTRILRAHFSAITPKDIQHALQNLGVPNKNEALSVDARQELDLKVGVAFSRFQTRYFQGKYGDLDSTLVSYGPCQTPTLGFCVQRHDNIQSFTPEKFWYVAATIVKDGVSVPLEWNRGRLFDQEVAHVFLHLVGEAGTVTVDKVLKSEQRRTKPSAMNTVEMLKEASKVLGMGPAQTMSIAERLYLSGYLSYPRTESTAYPESFDVRGSLALQTSHPIWGDYAKGLLEEGVARPRAGLDAGDHPPITPVRALDSTEFPGDMGRLYELVTRHFLATLSHDARFLQTKVLLSSTSGENFTVAGKIMIDPGYLAVLLQSKDENKLPDFREGERFSFASLALRDGQTAPPGYLTESELIEKMEKHGIGTDASISSHINNIVERNYVHIGDGRTLIPNPLGIVLVHGYLRIDADLVLPKVRAQIESECTLIAKGLADMQSVVDHSLKNFEAKFRYFAEHIDLMDSLFEATFSPLAATGKPLSKCGKCKRFMKYIHLKPQRLHCPTCNETYALPQNGTIKLYKELKCPLDDFELLLFSLGNSERAQGKSFTLCPYCYSHPPFEGLNIMGCDSCMHPTCKHSLTRNGVCPCPGESGATCPGTLVLDINSRPNWKMSCNRCNNLVLFKGVNIHNIKPLAGQYCDACGSAILAVDFHKDKTPLPGGETKVEGCVLCHDLLNGCTELAKGRHKHVAVARQDFAKRNRGRGGRGRGRGRGRGGKSGVNPLMSFEDF
ncbi:hypothetical protein VYU27_005564 [Nannochloropsis oceanica]